MASCSTSVVSPPVQSPSALQIESPKDTEAATSAASPPRCSSPVKCSICLGELSNKCYTNSCCHQFCFGCLLEWSKVKPECPLCKSSFRAIYHNIRSIDDYDEYHVPMNTIPHLSIRLTTSDPYAQILGADIDLRRHELDHGYSSSLTSGYIRERFGRIRDPRVIRILEVGPVSERRAIDAFMNSASSLSLDNPFYNETPEYFGSYHDGTTATATSEPATMRGYQNRRRIYDRCQWVQPFHSTLQPGTVFFPSVEYFRTHPSAFGRINTWLHREITVLLGLSRSRTEMGFVYDLILGLLLRYDIRSREFREMIRSYFGARVKHFQHEFYHFVLSGMRADAYDRVATYPSLRSGGASEGRYSGPPPVVTIGDSDDENGDDDDIVVIDDESSESTQPIPENERISSRTGRPRRPPPAFSESEPFDFGSTNSPLSPSPMWTSAPVLCPNIPPEQGLSGSGTASTSRESRRDSRHSDGCRRRERRRSSTRICGHNPVDVLETEEPPWTSMLMARPLTDDDFPILNLRSRAQSTRAEAGLNSIIESVIPPISTTSTAAETGAQSQTAVWGSGSRYPLRNRGGHETIDDNFLSTLRSELQAESAAVANLQPSYTEQSEVPVGSFGIGRCARKHTHRSRNASRGSHSHAHSSRSNNTSEPPSDSVSGSGGFGLHLNAIPGLDSDRERTSRRSSTMLDSLIDRPIKPKDEEKPKILKTQAPDDEDCLFEGIHPVVKKPPLAVITISSEDEDSAESSRRLKEENREREREQHERERERDREREQGWSNELDDFLSWSNTQQDRRNEYQLDDSLRFFNTMIHGRAGTGNEPGPSRRPRASQDPGPSSSASSTSRAKRTKSKQTRPKPKGKKTKEKISKAHISSSDSSDSEDEVQDGRRKSVKSRAGGKRKKSKPHKTVTSSRKPTKKRKMTTSSKSGQMPAKRSKTGVRSNSDESDSSVSSMTSASMPKPIFSGSDSEEIRLSSSSSPNAVDLRTRSSGLSSFERRWESNDENENENDDSDFPPMLLTENLSHSDSSNSSVDAGFTTHVHSHQVTSIFSVGDSSHEDTAQGSWSSGSESSSFERILNSPPSSQGSSHSHSNSSSNQTEDEAGLNARDLHENSLNEGRHTFLRSIIGSYNPNPSPPIGNHYTVNEATVSDLNPTSGLDLRLNSTIESWRQYVRSTSNPLDPINGVANLDGYWSSANDWMG